MNVSSIPVPSELYSLMLWFFFLLLLSRFSLYLSTFWLWLVWVFCSLCLSHSLLGSCFCAWMFFIKIGKFSAFISLIIYSLPCFCFLLVVLLHACWCVNSITHFSETLLMFPHSVFCFRLYNLYWFVFKFIDFHLSAQVYCWTILVNLFQLLYFAITEF